MTPTRVTFSKSSPLATIWVPTRMGTFSLRKRSRMASWGWAAVTVSVSIRRTCVPGKELLQLLLDLLGAHPDEVQQSAASGQAVGRGWE